MRRSLVEHPARVFRFRVERVRLMSVVSCQGVELVETLWNTALSRMVNSSEYNIRGNATVLNYKPDDKGQDKTAEDL